MSEGFATRHWILSPSVGRGSRSRNSPLHIPSDSHLPESDVAGSEAAYPLQGLVERFILAVVRKDTYTPALFVDIQTDVNRLTVKSSLLLLALFMQASFR